MLRQDPDRHVFVVQALADRHRQRGGPDDMKQWAAQIQNVAEDEMQLKNPRRPDAAGHFEDALNYWVRNGGDALVIEVLTRKALEARLQAGQYAQATSFAHGAIADRGAAAREVVGPIITNEAERLHAAGDDRAALALIDSALKMNPPLDDRHVRRLRTIQMEIQGPASDGRGAAVPTPGQ